MGVAVASDVMHDLALTDALDQGNNVKQIVTHGFDTAEQGRRGYPSQA